MSIVSEKRGGRERRLAMGRPPAGINERRANERRQTIMTNISFIEWATHFAAFQRDVTSKNIEPPAIAVPLAANDKNRK
jgi:hypothetical protein